MRQHPISNYIGVKLSTALLLHRLSGNKWRSMFCGLRRANRKYYLD